MTVDDLVKAQIAVMDELERRPKPTVPEYQTWRVPFQVKKADTPSMGEEETLP